LLRKRKRKMKRQTIFKVKYEKFENHAKSKNFSLKKVYFVFHFFAFHLFKFFIEFQYQI
jgi:hypothetical protein